MNSVHAATTSGPPTAVIGLSLRLSAYANSDDAPTAISTGTSESNAPARCCAAAAVRNRNTKRIAT